ncbi:serine hydrolase [Rhodococcoides yunnanense]|uniref:serine hydrolase n=1 Tax=Rhodococcoides yunnanense TaxID=278209 RepID=UPI000A05B971|nr:serine hydrolase [Rhodococcus yunnanensis]
MVGTDSASDNSAPNRSAPNGSAPNGSAPNGRRRRSFAVSVLALGMSTLLACSSASGTEETTTLAEAPPQVPPAQIDRERVDAAVGQLDGYVNDMMSRTGAPGIAVAVVYQDEVLYSKGFGVRKVGEPDAVDTSTMFQLASVSKPVASSVVASLVGEGKLDWDDPIRQFEPQFAVADPYVTDHASFTDLMSHRSGLPDHAGDLLEDLGYSYDDIVTRLNQVPLEPFRDNYDYTNYGFSAAGVAAAKSQGTTWAELSEQKIYEPLGMTNTTSSQQDWVNAPNHAYNHVLVDKNSNTWEAKYVSDPEGQAPAGGAASSVDDMAKWMRMELAGGQFDGDTVVDADALQFTHQAHALANPSATPGARDSYYGIGFNVGTDTAGRVEVSHAGAFGLGASTDVVMLPSEQLGIVVLANTAPVGVAETIAAQFMDYAKNGELTVDWAPFVAARFEEIVEHGRSETDYTDPPTSAAPAKPTSAYVGTYSSPFYGPAEVVGEGDGLVLKIGKNLESSYPLTHYDADTYWFEPIGENASGPTGAEFTVAEGAPTTLTVEYLDPLGLGTFTRS